MLDIPEGTETITVTNNSSRSFHVGGSIALPHIPMEVDSVLAKTISNSQYGSYFTFEFTPPPSQDTVTGGAGNDTVPAGP